MRLPRKVAQQRLRELKKNLKKKGRTPSDRQRVLCQWLVLITDLAADRFSLEEIFILYRVRWQIESAPPTSHREPSWGHCDQQLLLPRGPNSHTPSGPNSPATVPDHSHTAQ